MCGLVCLGGCNFVLLKVLYTAYGDRRAFFVNQAINLLYIAYGGVILYPRMLFSEHVTPEMRRFPKRVFLTMGILDSLGTFLTCLGVAYTPGSMTPLLNQMMIPFTMLVSALYLGVRCRWKEVAGAALIIVGACMSVTPNLLTADESGTEIRWYAVMFYAMSNLPMAMSACYKEGTFDDEQLDVWYLTQWVSIFQFLVSFLYMPCLVLPGFGSAKGMSMQEVPEAFLDGWHCFLEREPECANQGTFLLLIAYCGVNVCFNTLGLYLTKHGSAVLNALSFSVLLPFTTCLFFTPLLGRYQEPFTATSGFTFAALVPTLVGFFLYQRNAKQVGEGTVPLLEAEACHAAEEAPAPPPIACCAPLQLPPLIQEQETGEIGQPSFQERVVFMEVHELFKRQRSNTH